MADIRTSGASSGQNFGSWMSNWLKKGKSGPGTTSYNSSRKTTPTTAYGPSNPNKGLGLGSVSTTLPGSMKFASPSGVASSIVKNSKPSTALGGTPTSGSTSDQSYNVPSPSYSQDSDALAYLKDENATSQAMGSKNLVAAMRGGSGDNQPSPDDSYLQSLFADSSSPYSAASVRGSTGTTSQGSSILDQLRQQIMGLSSLSEAEQKAQDELTSFRENAQLGISGLEGQGRGIALGLIRGQQGKLAEQAGIKEQTLLDRLAAASAQRQNALQAATQSYNMASQEQAQQQEQKRYEQQRMDQLAQSGQASEMQMLQAGYQPITGGAMQVKQMGLSPDQLIKVGGKVYVKPQQQAAEPKLYTIGDTLVDSSGRVIFKGDTSKLTEINGRLVDQQGNIIYDGGSATSGGQASELTKKAYTLINELVTLPGLKGNVGAVRIALPGSAAATYRSKLNQLKAMLSLDNIKYLKGTGAISDKESALLADAAAALDPKMSESAFQAELVRLQQELGSQVNGGGSQYTPEELDYFRSQGIDPSTFTSAPSTALNGSAVQAVTQNYPAGSYGGQCGRFVNRLTGLKMGNTYQSKAQYIDPAIGTSQAVQPGDVFIMPYKQYGHTGLVADGEWIKKSDGTYDIPVIDSNWNNTSSPEKVSRHYINSSKMSGFARAPITSQRVSFT